MSVSPKRPKGPPLNAMRAFEAAARHVSFVAAADELNVTPGAISQHIKTLEAWTGTQLFRRGAQGVELTPAGESLRPDCIAAFDALAQATRSLHNLRPAPEFHIAALPSVAQLWLPSRLSAVRARFPQITFSVTALEAPPSLARELFDLSLFFAPPAASETQHMICPDEITPVCAPALQPGPGQGLEGVPLLHDQSWASDWSRWSDAAGIALRAPQSGPQFSLYSLAVEEAKAGAGALMGHLCLIEEALQAGTLVRMHDTVCTTGRALVMELPEGPQRLPETNQIVALLKDS